MKTLLMLLSMAYLVGCGTMVFYPRGGELSQQYASEMEVLGSMPNDYGTLIDSAPDRRAWREAVENHPQLGNVAAVWVFEERADIDTARPYTAKAVVVPGMVFHPPQKRHVIGNHSWGRASGNLVSVQCPGSCGYMVAFFK